MLRLKSIIRRLRIGRWCALAGSHRTSLSLRVRACHPNTRIAVRLLGPCFKTGRLTPFRQHQERIHVALRPSQAGAAASVRRAAYVARLNGHSRGLPAARSLRRAEPMLTSRRGKVHRQGRPQPQHDAGLRSAPRRPRASPAESPRGSHWGQAFPF